jgi:hypothetical protein
VKVTKWVEMSDTIDIEISVEDIISAMRAKQNPMTAFECKEILNLCLILIKKLPDDLIEKLGEPAKKIVYDTMIEQSKRYDSTR